MSIFVQTILMEKRVCTKCEIEKDVEHFHNDKQKKRTGKSPVCKECDKKRCRQWVSVNKEKRRFNTLKHKYGVTRSQYEQMFQKQGGRCAICNAEDAPFPNRLNVDHCHGTNQFRGLLCNRCNQGIGYFQESCDILEKAKKYIEQWRIQNQES